jgi:ribosomal protein S27AE
MSIIDQVKDVAKLAQEYGKIDLYQKAVDLQSQVTDLAAQNFVLSMALTESRQQIADLQDKLRLKGQVEYRRGVYYIKKDDGTNDGPFCSRCWEADHLLIHVDRNDHRYHCRNCEPHMKVKPPLRAPLATKPRGW